jgi:hypothetical protein
LNEYSSGWLKIRMKDGANAGDGGKGIDKRLKIL